MRALSRRGALAAAGSGLAVLAARPALAAAPPKLSGDALVLTQLLKVEIVVQSAYGVSVTSGSPRVRDTARRFGLHEAEHIRALATASEALGAPRIPPLRSVAELDTAAGYLHIDPVFSELRSTRELLRFLEKVEQASLATWHAAHGKLQDGRLLQTAATIMGCQAQHLVVLREALGDDPLPAALDAGVA